MLFGQDNKIDGILGSILCNILSIRASKTGDDDKARLEKTGVSRCADFTAFLG